MGLQAERSCRAAAAVPSRRAAPIERWLERVGVGFRG